MNGVRNLNSDKNQTIAALTVLILIWVGYRAALIAWGNFFGTDGAFSLDLALSILHTGVPRVPLWDGWVHASEYMFMHGVVNGIVQALVLAVTGGAYWFVSLKILSVLVAVGTLFLAFRWSVWSCRDPRLAHGRPAENLGRNRHQAQKNGIRQELSHA